jgi:FkbM family methyltransferase
MTIIHIGSHIGNTNNDPIFNTITNNDKLILVEPVPYLFELLKENYNKKYPNNNIIFINKAVSNYIGEINLNIPSIKNDFSKLPFWASQLSSVNNEHINIHILNQPLLKDIITENITAKTTTLNEIVKEYNIDNIDFLHTDTEGHDYTILKDYNFLVKPKKIMFEHKHIDGTFTVGEKYIDLITLLKNKNYEIVHQDTEDTTLILKD